MSRIKGGFVEHATKCYPRTTAYIALVVTILLILAILDMAGVL